MKKSELRKLLPYAELFNLSGPGYVYLEAGEMLVTMRIGNMRGSINLNNVAQIDRFLDALIRRRNVLVRQINEGAAEIPQLTEVPEVIR